ncbi:hypothetical protein ACX3YG_18270 [Pseudomonas wadenswilerensis]
MSNLTVDELLAWMEGKSKTFGWSALVAYDRTKANDLLTQLYIERFNSDSYLPSLSETLDHGDGALNIEHVYDLTFAMPKLHFETANISDSRVEVSLDFIGGMIISEYRPRGGLARIDKVQKVLPLNSPQLTMSVVLADYQGQVGEDGTVSLDISSGDRFTANFVAGSLSQQEIGDRFKLYFESLLEDGNKVLYPLGTLAGENGVLTPERFDLRTMAAPGATRRDAPNYRDGAVLLFVKLREGTAGSTPTAGSDFEYPLPVAADGTNYSAGLWLSSRTLMEKLIKSDIQDQIGNELTFKPYGGSNDLACELVANSGGLLHPKAMFKLFPSDSSIQVIEFSGTWNYLFGATGPNNTPLTVTLKGNQVELYWKCDFKNWYKYKRRNRGWWDDAIEGDLYNESLVNVRLDAGLDPSGVVHFKESERSISVGFRADRWLSYITEEFSYGGTPYLNSFMRNAIFPSFEDAMKDVSLPSIDTFLVRNLLFPGENAMRPSDVYVPGDLVLFGHLDPKRTSFKITPLQPTVAAGGEQLFKTVPEITGVTWTVHATDEADTDIGSIDTKGIYRAAPASALIQGYQRVVVTATGKLDGLDVTSSAMVSVVETTISVAPLFQVCDLEQEYTLTAETVSGQDPEWSLKDPSLGGTLSDTTGPTCIYTPPPLKDPDKPDAWPDIVLVKDPASGSVTEAVVLVINHAPNVPVLISEDSDPSSGKLQVQVYSETQGPMDPIAAGFTASIVAGPGTMTPEGLYTEPKDASGIAVVALTKPPPRAMWNFIVMPLPLSVYGELIRDVTDVMLEYNLANLPADKH